MNKKSVLFSLVVLLLGILYGPYVRAQTVRSCLGTGRPDISDGAFDCTVPDIVPLTGEWGNFLFIDYDNGGTTLTIDQVVLDLSPALDAEIAGRYTTGDNRAGVTITNENLIGNQYTVSFQAFSGGISTFYLHFDFDKPSYGTGTPLGADYGGATLTVTLSDGTVLNGNYSELDFFGAITHLGGPTGPIDIWIKDCDADDGTVPSAPGNCPQWWKSPDIWIDNDGNQIIDAPVLNEDNILKAQVRNGGVGVAQNVNVKFYYRDNSTGLVFPDGATFIDETTVTVPPNGVAVASVLWPNLPPPPSTGGHWCIGVVLDHSDDARITPTVIPPEDNNIGIANIWFIAARAGQPVELDFNMGTGGSGGFGLRDWPRDFVVTVDDRLPTGWTWELEGADVDKVFTMKLGETRPAKLKVRVADDAGPHERGSIDVRQIDVATGRPVGGVHYDLYEDHHPPEAVRALEASLVDGHAVLTWNRVLKEVETNLSERIAFYEILRDGKAVAKVLRDGDPRQPGMQWKDPDSGSGRLTYTIRVVDEGGNVSVLSPEAIVAAPAGLVNWLTWLLLILILILLILLLRKKLAAHP